MGRRSTATTKSGKYMNPTDQARKEARRRELKKNKKQRQLVRDAVLRSKNVRELCSDLDKLEEMELGLRESEVSNEKAVKEKKKRTSDTLLKILKFYEKNDRHQYVEAKKLYEDSENKRRKLREEVFKPYGSTGQQELEAICLPDIPLPPETPGTTLAPSDIPLPEEHKPEPLPAGLTPPGPPPGPIPERARRIPDSLQPELPDSDHTPKGILKQQSHEYDSQSSSGSDSGNSSDEEEEKSGEPQPKRSVRFAPDENETSKTPTTSEVTTNASGPDKLEAVKTGTPTDIQPTPALPMAQHFQSTMPYPPMLPPSVISNPPVMPLQFRPPPPRDMFPPPPPPPPGPLQFMPGQPPPHLPHMGIPPPMPPSFGRGIQPPPPPPGVTAQQPIHTSQPSAVLSAPPVLTGSSSYDSGGKDGATISAEPQLRNTQAEVTKFMPTSLRIRRDQPRLSKPRPKAMPIRPMKTGEGQKAAVSSVTKDDAYTQFMKEMEGLM